MIPLSSTDITRLSNLLDVSGSIVMTTHMHPDGDAIGSSTAMLHYLRAKRGKAATLVIQDPLPDAISFLSCEGITTASEAPDKAAEAISGADLIICLDFNHFGRTGACVEPHLRASAAKKVLIDHHLDPARELFEVCFSETEISSASELLFHVLMAMPDVAGDPSAIPAEAATALMTGMTTDTNNFANSVFPSTLGMASALLGAGVDRDFILGRLYQQFRPNRVAAMGYVLDRKLTVTPEGVALMVLDAQELRELDLRDGETEGFVNIPLATGDVKMSVFLKEDDGYFRVSTRSKRGISANLFARTYCNGGGHEMAAGGRLYIPDDVKDAADATQYILTSAARFMQDSMAADNK